MTERRPVQLPLLSWSSEFSAARARRRTIRRRATAIAVLAAGLGLTVMHPPQPLLVWNASASAPIGLYSVSHDGAPRAGDLVIARVPERYRQLAARRRYLPANVPLVKRVAAAPGDRVCARDDKIFVRGRLIAARLARDGQGRPMPWWSGCVTLGAGTLFLLMDDPASFDGRYFGPTGPRDIIGRAALLWAR